MKRYRFIGLGRGVPGLPHLLTEDEAVHMGVEKLLDAALVAGTYEVVPPEEKTAATEPAVEKTASKAEKKSAKDKEA